MNDQPNLNKYDLGAVYINEPLAPHTSWKIGGPADIFVEPHNIEQIANVIQYARSEDSPLVVIGNATNLLFSDEGVRGIVMRIGDNFSKFKINGTHIYAEAGASIQFLAKNVGTIGLTGLEHTVGIPATLGGLVYMNGGSQKKSIGDNIQSVTAIDKHKGLISLSRDECNFSYRYSSFQDTGQIICTIDLELAYRNPDLIISEMQTILESRERKFPLLLPSCGSVFSISPKLQARFAPPGKLIEDAGLKGIKIGDAQISDRHANFIVNLGKAKSKDVIDLVHLIRRTIWNINDIWLEAEVRYVKPNGEIIKLHEE